ncbi:YceI family protein [Microbulbifer harenosus]|uniref:YceI family protein n=1 Tax=Microbulbifer harenosus TaxID=2576840 RepID=A0ABY2UKJ7_9GAMM|nr:MULTISPECIES: YceI family protein [Microbulbifer]QIL89397.1 YceI family protein [Microbulbifer sp. SH-1]TLM78697.1 YceI family protein [Microbulbifer harenosus]
MSFKSFALASLLALPASAFADWQLAGDDSSVNFVSVKKANIAEMHHFKSLSGNISDAGKAQLVIDLASVETNIPIRNERMQQMLFETAKFAKATISADVDAAKLKALKPGQTASISADITVDVHGQQQSEKATLQVTGLEGGKLLVTTGSPIVINAGNYKLLEGIEKLRQVAGLDSISPIVPVTAKLVFAQN